LRQFGFVWVAVLVALGLANHVGAQITFVNYTNSGTDARIGFQRIGVTRGGSNFAYWDTEVIMASLNRINGQSNVTVITPGGPTKDANAFLRDAYLNTGIESIGIGTGLTAGDQWTQITFDQPIVNSAGPDGFVATEQFPDIVIVPLRLATPANHSVTLTGSTAMVGSSNSLLPQYTYLTPVATPADLTNATPNPSGSLVNPSWVIETFDLSSMSVPMGQSVSSLYLQKLSNNGGAFPTFIAGFPAVPEPSTFACLIAGLICTCARRVR
jgi:hypothetical protein